MNSGNQPSLTPSWPQTPTPVVINPATEQAGKQSASSQSASPYQANGTSDQNESQEQSRQTLRVLHVVNGEHFSGAERVQSHLGRCLPESDVTADFAFVKPGQFAELVDREGGAWGRGFRVPMSNRFDFRPAMRIGELIRAEGYQLLHAHTPRTAMIASVASTLARIPWVYHVHSPAARDSTKSLTNHINAGIEKLALYGCRHLITVSESLRLDCIRRGAHENRVTVVHNGVPAICPPRLATPKVNGRWVIGMVALMRPRKGLEIALDALAKLRDKYDVTLRIIGPFETESYECTINARIEQLALGEAIERVGFTSDVPSELAKLDAMVLPSLFGEGLPMVVLEAMAAGLPVIATRVEGTPEAVTDGVEGLLAIPRDSVSLADKIGSLITGKHDWATMSQAAHDRHSRDFSDSAMARSTAEVYRKVLKD